MESDQGFLAAVEEAKAGFEEGGVPIGACLVSKDGEILGRGHNLRVQKGSATLHVGYSLEIELKAGSDQNCLSSGRDIDIREHRQASSFSIQRRNNVHVLVSM